jgi:hypothetical protein
MYTCLYPALCSETLFQPLLAKFSTAIPLGRRPVLKVDEGRVPEELHRIFGKLLELEWTLAVAGELEYNSYVIVDNDGLWQGLFVAC